MADPITWGLVLQNKVLLDKIKDLIGGIDVETPISDVLDELKTLINAVDDNVDGVSGKVDVVDGVVDGIATDVDSLQTSVTDVQSTVNTIANKNLINADSIVKSVQRGKTSPLLVETVNSKTIPISAINLSKSVLIINYMSTYNAINNLGVELYQNYIHLTMNNTDGNYRDTLVFSWQVIEFY